jgi:hypothetical protein
MPNLGRAVTAAITSEVIASFTTAIHSPAQRLAEQLERKREGA